MSHTPEFIEEMKQRLMQEKVDLEAELKSIAHPENSDAVADFPEYGRNEEENAMEIADYQSRQATTDVAEKRLVEVVEALQAIDSGTYGVTKEGEMIPEGRLRANPAATTIVKPSE